MKKVAILVCILALLSVSACSIGEYDKEVRTAIVALKDDQYGNALTHLTKAQKVHPTVEVNTYIDETKRMQSSVQAIEQGDYAGAKMYANQLVTAKDSSEITIILKGKASAIINKVNQWDTQQHEMMNQLQKAQSLANEKKYDEAETILKQLSDTTSQSEQIKALAKQANQLWQEVDQEKQGKQSTSVSPVSPSGNQPLTKSQAEDAVRAYLKIPANSRYIAEYDQTNDKGLYVIHVYEQVHDASLGHSATMGYYIVDPSTGNVSLSKE